ncbi:MAG: T9SS type A sorting domain-containing protein [Bacteroidetes bacterium]|nr:T9SS type A sorting domain-containing protein [Bacteroidota bacterium]
MKIFFIALPLQLFTLFAHAQDPAYPNAPAALGNMLGAEYYIDTDPGLGNATPITIPSPNVDVSNVVAALNTSSLSNGIHRFGFRTKNTDGVWSHTDIEIFLVDYNPAYPASPIAPTNMVAAEYFIDTDPGFGNATSITIPSPNVDVSNVVAALNTSSLSNGIHRFGLRTKNADGKWGLTNMELFLVDYDPAYAASASTPTNMVAAEYFIDTDPGFGNATSISIPSNGTDVSDFLAYLSTSSLSNGVHRFGIRSKNADGRWSLTNIQDFLIDSDPAYPPAPAALGNITYVEYFFDTDPGFGNGTIIPITVSPDLNNIAFVANTSALSDATHVLFIRSLDDWSLTNFESFTKGNPVPLDFLTFTAVASVNDVVLNWETENEINTSHFVIEFSKGDTTFLPIGETTAANVSGKHHYRFVHVAPGEGRLFYRIRQVDQDEKFKFSPIAALNLGHKDNTNLVIYPNPTTDLVWFKNINSGDISAVQISDMHGRVFIITPNAGTLQLNVSNLSKGVYAIKLIMRDGSNIIRSFVKQ